MGRLEFCKIGTGMDGDCMTMGEEEGLSRGNVTTINIGRGTVKILLQIRRIGRGGDLEDQWRTHRDSTRMHHGNLKSSLVHSETSWMPQTLEAR
jgi:hypothetical protein